MGMGSERLDFTVGVVGAGSMGAPVASGLVRSGAMDASQVSVSNSSEGKLRPLAEMGISTFRSNADMLEGDVQVVVLAVKPQILPSVVGEMGEALKGRLVISIAAGIPLNTLEGLMPSSRVVRAMPNLPVQALSGRRRCAWPQRDRGGRQARAGRLLLPGRGEADEGGPARRRGGGRLPAAPRTWRWSRTRSPAGASRRAFPPPTAGRYPLDHAALPSSSLSRARTPGLYGAGHPPGGTTPRACGPWSPGLVDSLWGSTPLSAARGTLRKVGFMGNRSLFPEPDPLPLRVGDRDRVHPSVARMTGSIRDRGRLPGDEHAGRARGQPVSPLHPAHHGDGLLAHGRAAGDRGGAKSGLLTQARETHVGIYSNKWSSAPVNQRCAT